MTSLFRIAALLAIGLVLATPSPAQTLAAGATDRRASQQTPDLEHRPTQPAEPAPDQTATVRLLVPTGTPLEVAIDREIAVHKVGQTIQGRIVEPVYAFDKLVIPAGAIVSGHISGLEAPSASSRTESALNADFTPPKKVSVTFDQITLPSGARVLIDTRVTAGSGQLLNFVTADDSSGPKRALTAEASLKLQQAKQQARSEWNKLMSQISRDGRIHRARRYALEQLPAHRQFIAAGTIYFAELQSPLPFGTEPFQSETTRSMGDIPSSGEIVHARLATGVDSSLNRKGDAVRAIVTQPVFDNGQLIVPEGSVLSGDVVQVRPARRWKHNGELRLAFHSLTLPDGFGQPIEANLESVESGKTSRVTLDSEGGAQATTPKTRYLSTAIELGLTGLALRGDPDAKTADPTGTTGSRMAGGAAGYKLIGIALGIAVQSRAFSYSMGAYGAGISVYNNFISRGSDVVFPKDTAMQIGLGTDAPQPGPTPATSTNEHQ